MAVPSPSATDPAGFESSDTRVGWELRSHERSGPTGSPSSTGNLQYGDIIVTGLNHRSGQRLPGSPMTITSLSQLGPLGLWTHVTQTRPPAEAQMLARAVEQAGFGCVWLPEALGYEALTHASLILAGTSTLPVATGIASIWARDAMATHAGTRLLRAAYDGRFVIGLGVSHRVVVDGLRGHDYAKPVTAMTGYLEQLEALDDSMGDTGPRVIAGLGPRMLDLAVEHHAGVLTYLTTPGHTADARRRMGDGHLSVELPVVIGDDAEARSTARKHLSTYLSLENYRASFLRLGFSEEDMADHGSDRLLDGVFSLGTLDAVRRAVRQRLDAGADHVALHPLDRSTLDQVLGTTAAGLV